MTAPAVDRAVPSLRLKISAAYGRLYVSGPDYEAALMIHGAAHDYQRHNVQLSLTLETLRSLRGLFGVSVAEFAKCCTPQVLQWARAAGKDEQVIAALHQRIEHGWRMEFPWLDNDHNDYRPAFDHQKVMASVACHLNGCAFLAEMGTAKTRAAIEAMQFMMKSGQIDVSVVVCPKRVMKTWIEQIAMWSEGMEVVRLEGKVKDRIEIINGVINAPSKPLIIVLNYEVLYLLEAPLRMLMRRLKVSLILDEMHKIRNPQTKVSKAAMSLAQEVQWRIGMTGTPILQGAHDIWSQWYFIDLGITFGANFVQFRREFFDENTYTFKIEPKNGTLDEIGLRIRRRGLRYTKAECLDLPPKIYETVQIDMTPQQAKAYHEMEDQLVAELDNQEEQYATAQNQLVMILRLTQITSGFVKDSEGRIFVFPVNPKLEELEEMVRDNITSQPTIVWAWYQQDIEQIARKLADLKPALIYGKNTSQEHDKAEADFQSGKTRLLVGNQKSGGLGLNLQAAGLANYYSQNQSLEARLQSEDRCHRAGSEIHAKVTYTDFVMRGTVDEIVGLSLQTKQDVADLVVDLKRAIGARV